MRSFDYVRLLLLQRPIRCHICLHRSYVNIFFALLNRGRFSGSQAK